MLSQVERRDAPCEQDRLVSMAFEDVHMLGNDLDVVSHEDVDAVEHLIGATFPDGYREFVTTLGSGQYNAGYVHVLMPRSILAQYEELQWTWRENAHFWQDSALLSAEDLGRAIVLARTVDGDELVFHGRKPRELYVVPRHADEIYLAGENLQEALEWVENSGVLASRTRVSRLRADGRFDHWTGATFRPYRNVERAEFLCRGAGNLYAEMVARMACQARADMEGTVLVTLADRDLEADGAGEEVAALYLTECAGEIRCQPYDESTVRVFVSYDATTRSRRTEEWLGYLAQIS
ncbi:hypothetical protein GCM10022262_29740 [Georgenia daeguensis]|uniref:Knr4/Smi1-like domain-containing protein n=1 Tax=Georgenia daeguensis TaxID=908355 RepID=A0ABP8EX89_9MICO